MENPVIFSYISHCKINLGLSVLNKRNDNLHNLESIFVEVSLADTLTFKKSNNFIFSSNNTHLSQLEDNTIHQAYHMLAKLSTEIDVLMTIDANTGQNGMQQVREYKKYIPISGVILTKMDGTTKGGIAIPILSQLKILQSFRF